MATDPLDDPGLFAQMPPSDAVETWPLVDWMHANWGCTCDEVDVVVSTYTDGSGGLRIVHEAGCARVAARYAATR